MAGLGGYLLGLAALAAALVRRIRRGLQEVAWVPSVIGLAVLAAVLADALGNNTLFDAIPAATLALFVGPALVLGRPGWAVVPRPSRRRPARSR